MNISYSQKGNAIIGDTEKLNTINELRVNSRKKAEFSQQERFTLAERARRMSVELGIDTTIIKSNRRISSIYYEMENYNLFKKINKETLELAKKINDSNSIAKANFNLGNYYYITLESDSAYHHYYQSEKIYISQKEYSDAGGVLLNMAIIQKNEKDFIGSEETSIKAISYLEKEENLEFIDYESLSSIYNNLAIVSGELENYEKAIEYYEKAIDYSKKNDPKDKLSEFSFLNNLATIYQKSENYEKALSSFKSLLDEKEIKEKDLAFYAIVLNNYAKSKFLIDKDDKELPSLYLESLSIKESIDDKGSIMRSCIDIANYYLEKNRLELAFDYANRAYEIADRYNLYDDKLETLFLLSKIEKGDIALAYSQEYIVLNDRLHKEERAIRNKFGRIKFDTDKIEEQNVKFSRERELFLFLAIAGLVGVILIYIIISQRARNNELRFTQEQQKANEEIYNLMLSQQDKIEEGRTKEKQRISEDLHDGILGRLFGTRLSLDSLNMSSDKDAVKNRGQYIDELKSIEQEIRRISHDLNADFVAGSGYLDIVKTLIENQTQLYNKLSYNFIHKDEIDWEIVSNKTKIHFYRMIQESLQNIYKHANAKHIDISFEMKDHQIYLNIEDDGEGFVVNKAKKGIGLKNIKSRVEELKGELFINSQKDSGTRISISVPL